MSSLAESERVTAGTARDCQWILDVAGIGLDSEQADADLQRSVHKLGKFWVLECEPNHEPRQVAQIADVLLAPYQVQEGRAQLAGCVFEDRPLLGIPSASPAQSTVQWFDEQGSPLPADGVRQLGLNELKVLPPRLTATEVPQILSWIESTKSPTVPEFILIAWHRFVSGKIAILTGTQNGYIPFGGWAADFLALRQKPPKFQCPASGLASYQICSTDDGVLTVPSALGVCAQTQRRVLRSELVTCGSTGDLIWNQCSAFSQVSGIPLRRDVAVRCDWCQRLASSPELQEGRCEDCRALHVVQRDDAALAQLMDMEHQLSRFHAWQGTDLGVISVRVGRSWLSEVLRVIDRSEHRVVRSATRHRFGPWHYAE